MSLENAPEFALRDGLRAERNNVGVVFYWRYDDEGPHLQIVDAPQHIQITNFILSEVFWFESVKGEPHPFATLERAKEGHGSTGHGSGDYDCGVFPGSVCFHNAIFKINAEEKTMIYRVDKYLRELDRWTAHWPD